MLETLRISDIHVSGVSNTTYLPKWEMHAAKLFTTTISLESMPRHDFNFLSHHLTISVLDLMPYACVTLQRIRPGHTRRKRPDGIRKIGSADLEFLAHVGYSDLLGENSIAMFLRYQYCTLWPYLRCHRKRIISIVVKLVVVLQHEFD